MTSCRAPILCTLLLLTMGSPWLQAQESVLMKAMRDELGRSMEKLQLEGMEKPYYVAYWVQEFQNFRVAASLGGVLNRGGGTSRSLSVQVRVGNPDFDNTNFFDFGAMRSGVVWTGMPTPLPLADDYAELRRQIWLATDGAYKQAVHRLAKKRAALQNKTRAEEVADFSQEEPVEFRESRPPADLADAAQVETTVKELSALFQEATHVFASLVRAHFRRTTTYFVNSEGSSYVQNTPSARIQALAGTQASDGTELEDFVVTYGRSWEDLPGQAELAKKIRGMTAHLERRREAEDIELYSGPVIFEGQAAAELVSQVLVPRLLAQRVPTLDDPRNEQFLQRARNPFQDRLGARVLPRFLSVVDDPTVGHHGPVPLLGGYEVDEEGVRSGATTVVRRGILKTLLTTRNPVRGVPNSTGNRRNMGPAPSNLFVRAKNGMNRDEIKTELLSLVEERGLDYGIIVRRLGNPHLKLPGDRSSDFMMPGSRQRTRIEPAILAYKVLPDGREEPIRKVTLSGVSESSFRDIVAASDTAEVYDMEFRRPPRMSASFFMMGGGGSMEAPLMSLVTPSLLFEDLTLKRPAEDIPRPPVTPPPSRGQ